MKNNTWKTKIDPAFDELIKIYRDILSRIQLPKNTGYVALDDETCKFLERRGFPSLNLMYETFKLDQNVFSELARLGVNENIEFVLSSSEDLNKTVLKLAKTLPAQSKAYYLKKFKPYLLPEEKIRVLLADMHKEEIIRLQNELRTDLNALFFHAGSIGYWDLKSNTDIKTKARVDRTAFISASLLQTYDSISQLTHKRPLKTIIEEARKGSDRSLFKAIQIDKTLFDFEWVRKRIRKAMLSGDHEFFGKLGKAIKTAPLENDVEYGELYLILKFFWGMGLNRLDNEELKALLEASGIKALPKNQASFGRLKRRIISNL